MKKYIIKRTLQVPVTLIVISIILTVIFIYMPGGFATGLIPLKEKIELRKQLGLDQPKYAQVIWWIKSILTGKLFDVSSFAFKVPIKMIILQVLSNSLFLYGLAFLISCIVSIFLGAISAWKGNSAFDNFVRIACLIGISIPFVIAEPLIHYYLFWVRRITDKAYENYWLFRITLVVMTLYLIPLMTKHTRSIMLDVFKKDYITTARAKGVKEILVVFKHGIRNIYTEIFAIIGGNLNKILFYGFLIEAIFNYPGIGALSTFAFMKRDYPLMLGCVFINVIIIVMFNYIFDIMANILNPMIKIK